MARKNRNEKKKKQMPSMVEAAGRKDAETVSEKHGPQFYKDIENKSGSKSKELLEKGKRNTTHK